MHIVIVFHTSLPQHIQGGINTMIVTLAREWVALGHRVSIFAPGEWHHRRWTTETFEKITIHKKRMRRPWEKKRKVRSVLGFILEAPVLLWQLWRFCQREQVDVIHLHTPRSYQWYILWLQRFRGPPYVLTFHGTDALDFANGTPAEFSLMYRVVREARALTSVSRHYAQHIENRFPELGTIHYLANGIDLSGSTPGLVGRKETPFPGPLPQHYFIIVGWVEPPKAQDVIIKAWGFLKEAAPELHVLIIGKEAVYSSGESFYPGYRDSLETLIDNLGCRNRVHLLGGLDPETLLYVARRAEGLVFPSLREGLPYALLEAGALALPVVCHDIPAFSAIVRHEENGLLVAGSDPQQWASAVRRLHEQPKWAKELGYNLFTTIRDNYSAQIMARGYLQLFATLTGTTSDSGAC
ncbi:MAG: glycosyltransferase family 4 protein [Magnetococcales bacterium]|nr:glycosyltransferase family 4 protein [Magnetococcales bacterium]